jgi:hypothetical protein
MSKRKKAPWLSHAGRQLRDQIDDRYPNRDRRSDGWVADSKHSKKSDHTPRRNGVVRAIDIDAGLGHSKESWNLAQSIVLAAKAGDKRIKYVIHNGQIASKIRGWRFRPYTGSNSHHQHIHISFTRKGDRDGSYFAI